MSDKSHGRWREVSEQDDLTIESLHLEGSQLDMKFSGIHAKLFMDCLIGLFEQNGAENYLAMEFGTGGKWYEVIINKKTGSKTAASELNQLKTQLEAERAKVRELEEAMQAVKSELNAMDGIYHKFYTSMGDPFRASQQIHCCAVKAMEAIENAMKNEQGEKK